MTDYLDTPEEARPKIGPERAAIMDAAVELMRSVNAHVSRCEAATDRDQKLAALARASLSLAALKCMIAEHTWIHLERLAVVEARLLEFERQIAADARVAGILYQPKGSRP